MPERPSHKPASHTSAVLIGVGLALSLGLTIVVAISWGVARSNQSPWADTLATLSFWVAVGAVPIGVAMVIAALIIRGYATPERREIERSERSEDAQS